MATIGSTFLRGKLSCQCILRKSQARLASNDVVFSFVRPESKNHSSGLPERIQFASEHRGLFIQQSIEHLKSLENVKIKQSVKQILINDQHKTKGFDDKSLFLYDKIPALKYNNPHVPIICTQDGTQPWNLSVQFEEENENVEVPLDGLTSEEIFTNLCHVICEETT